MITLFGFGPGFGLPDPSPFVTKAELLLKLAGLPYRLERADLRKAPKGKLPFIRDGQETIADSTLIRWHLERRHGIDLDAPYGARDRAIGWAVERMLEDHLYWAVVDARWMDDANFARGPALFFQAVPAPLRPVVTALIRRKVRASLRAQGFGRHDRSEIVQLGERSISALAGILAAKPYLLGDTAAGVDATAWAFVAGILCPLFETPLRQAAERHGNLVAYRDRLLARFYPAGLPEASGPPGR